MNSVIFLLGPTGVGKSEVSILLAKEINAEIISADSMQVYQGMDIGTAKLHAARHTFTPLNSPCPTDGRRAPQAEFNGASATRQKRKNHKNQPVPVIIASINHYLIDIIEPNEEFNVARFVQLAEEAIEQIHKRNKIPLIVGGSALYIYSLIKGIFELPINTKFSRQLEIENENQETLYQKLVAIDPKAAAKIHPRNLRRIRRALEVYYQTGIPFSQLNQQRKGIDKKYKIIKIGLICPRPLLHQRVEQRVEKMFKQGLIEEVKRIKGKMGRTAAQALGYKEVIAYLNGEVSLEELKDLIKKNTRHFVKHQLSWFRKDKEIKWVEIDNKDKKKIVKEIKRFALLNSCLPC